MNINFIINSTKLIKLKVYFCLSKYNLLSNNKIANKIIYLILLAFISSIILLLNIKTPMNGDDYVYSFIYNTSERISSLSDIWESQITHYNIWGGRSIVHFITQTLLLIGNPLLVDLINTSVFIVLILCMQYHIIGKFKSSISLTFIVFCLIWFLQPAFAETILWLTGSCNYLWGTVIILLFLLPYRIYKNNKISKTQAILYSILMLLFGVIAGWTNENTAAAMIVISSLFIFFYKFKKWNIQSWSYLGLLGSIIGYTIMILAPGNFARAAEAGPTTPFLIIFRTLTHTQTFISYLGLLNLGIAILAILYIKFKSNSKRLIFPFLFLYFIGVVSSIYVMVLSPGFPPRAWFGVIIFNIITFGIVFYNLNYQLRFIQAIKICIISFCAISFFFSFYEAYKDVNEIDKIWKSRLIELEQKKKQNAETIIFKKYNAKTKFGLGDAPYAKKYISQYYDIEFELE